MTENESGTEDDGPTSESTSEDDRRVTDDIPSVVPDPEAPLRGEDVPDDWLNQRQPTPSGRPGGW
jgi:hypothetical protein